jgi:hypothetical protein
MGLPSSGGSSRFSNAPPEPSFKKNDGYLSTTAKSESGSDWDDSST